MTSKEAYLKIQDFINDIQLGITRSSLDIVEPLNVIRNLTKQSHPTLSECIKEWKTLGYEFKEDQKSQYIFISSLLAHLEDKHILIFLNHSTRVMFSEYGEFTTQELMLLAQTLKALEVEENDKN